jgi:HK97 family phage major capsid protein
MRTVAVIARELMECNAKITALFTKKDSSPTDDAELVALDARAAELKAELAAATTRDEIAARAAASNAELSAPRPGDQPTSPVSERAVSSGLRERALDNPTRGFRSYSDFAMAVRANEVHNSRDDRLSLLDANANDPGSDGGFLVPPEYSNRIFERMTDANGVMGKCDRINITGNSITMNGMVDHDKSSSTYRYAGVVSYWVEEGGSITASDLKFRQITLRPHKIAALSVASAELLQDSPNFGNRLLEKHAEAINDTVSYSLFFGTGVGQPLGAFVGAPSISVAAEDGQTTDTIIAENALEMYQALWPKSISTAEWYYTQSAFRQLATMCIMTSESTGQLVYMPAGGLSGTPYGTILGRPAYPSEYCAALGNVGDILLADWSQYLLGVRGGVDTEMSIHLYFDKAQNAYRSMFRVDGRPTWDVAMTDRNSNSVSPFVKLAAR